MEDQSFIPYPIFIMGIKITPFPGYVDACATIGKLIDSRRKAFSVAINPEKIYRAGLDSRLKTLLNQADIAICDGIGAAMAARFLHGKTIPRITGISLFFELVRSAEMKGWKIFILGASKSSNQEACEKLIKLYPTLRIVGRIDGYFQDSKEVVRQINESQADILFVALGSPKQEYWIAENREEINSSFCMGVGGSLDVVSGKARWAPPIFRKTGTEWLYRLMCEPRRWRRQMVLPKFAFSVVKQKIAGNNQ